MKIVIVSSCGVRPVYILREVGRLFADVTLLRVHGDALRKRKANGQARPPLGPRVRDRFETLHRDRRIVRYERALSKALFGADSPPEVESLDGIRVVDVAAAEVNDPKTARLLEEISPTILVTIGAPILKPLIFEKAALGALNVHFGIAPAYRGEHTLFWALRNRDFDQVGVTLHYLDPGIDTGKVIAKATLDLDPHDRELDVLVKATRAASALLIDYLSATETAVSRGRPEQERPSTQLPPTAPRDPGHLYLRKQRTLASDVGFALRRLLLREHPPKTLGRITREYERY